MARNPVGIQTAYVEEVVRLMARDIDGIQFVIHQVEGTYPNFTLEVLFRVPGYSPCLYGVRDHIWAENEHESISEAVQSAGNTWDRIVELASALPIELPKICRPDHEGVTWVDLWSDESAGCP